MALYLKLNNAPNANQCRKLLGDLEWAKEKRKGRVLYIYLYLLIGIPAALFMLFPILSERSIRLLLGNTFLTSFAILYGLLLTASSVWFTSREIQLAEQTAAEPLFKEIVPLLNTDEKPLVLASGMIASGRMPSWLSSGHPSAFFIFTSDRLLMITLNTLFITGSQIHNHFANGTFNQVVDSIYTVDLLDKNNIIFGGINKKRFLFSFAHTQFTFTPVGETDSITIVLNNNLTRSGRLLKTIRDRLENGYSNRF